ncbi:MAG: sigma-54 dependent transcriptional regulator [Pseudomonadota bacterium]
MQESILIVDDDPVERRLIEANLTKFGFRCLTASGGEEALAILREQTDRIAVMILDLVMPDLDGMGVLETMRRDGYTIPVIVQTAQGGIDTVVSAMRAGAHDFAVKPVSPERLKVSINNAMKVSTLETELRRVKRSVTGTLTFEDVISKAERMERVIELGKRAAASTIPILLEGETGVGKEMIARAIQGSSKRRTKPFVTLNCGAVPETLVESILFGHEKGAFTGATERKIGKFKEADGGTLFLDEIGELTLDLQVKLLRALQEGEIDPVGGRRTEKVDIRVISATNRSLIDMVKAGTFREDLYYRLNVFPITIPPLRDRMADIPALARHFTARFAAEEGRRHIKGLSRDALEMLSEYHWPGNIRQLENTIFRAVVLCDADELTEADFPQITAGVPLQKHAWQQPSADEKASIFQEFRRDDTIRFQEIDLTDPNVIGAHEFASSLNEEDAQDAAMRLIDVTDNIRPLDELEAEIIRAAFIHYNGHISEMARRLKIGRSTLYRKMKEYGIGPEDLATANG